MSKKDDKHRNREERKDQEPKTDQAPPPAFGDQGQASAVEQPAEPAIEQPAEPAIEQKLAAVAAERDDLLARLQRVSADYLNYQKRVRRDIDEARQFGLTELILSLLDVTDDLERAIEHARANHPSDDPLLAGTELVYKKAADLLKRNGVERIASVVGQAFDPTRHQALVRQPTADAPPMTVLAEAQKGYSLNGRTIRPAKVLVAVAPSAGEQAGPQAPESPPGNDGAEA